MTEPLTPESLAELREQALMSRCYSGGRAVGIAPDELIALLDAAAERDELAAKVEAVRALHFGEYVEDEDRSRCFECGDDWPCPTIRALDEEPAP